MGGYMGGYAYQSTLQPLYMLQKKAIRIITFSHFQDHTSPLYRTLKIIKLFDVIFLHLAIFMHKFNHHLLPSVFDAFFTPITGNKVHKYNTRLSSKMSYSLPKARTNYGIFNIRFQGVKVWNSLDESTKLLSPPQFKKKLKLDFIDNY